MAISHLKNEKTIIIICDNCFDKITHKSHIKCKECKVDLCMNCFFTQAKPRFHSTSHLYRAVEPLNFKLNNDQWTALEELLLIEALEINGLGNWQEVRDYIGTKNTIEIEEHFYKISELQNNKEYESTEKLPIVSNPNNHEIVSYMPLRKDFDTEIENDYETIFKDINSDFVLQSDEMRHAKDAIYDSYRILLKLRNYKKFIALEKNLINYKELQKKEELLDDEEKMVLKMLKPLSCYLSKKDFNLYYEGISIENELKRKINEKKVRKCDFLNEERRKCRLLSNNERELCMGLKMTFKEYLKVKEKIVCEKITAGYMDLKKMKKMLRCYDKKTEFIYDFFIANEWI